MCIVFKFIKTIAYIYIYIYRPIDETNTKFASGPGDWRLIPGQVIPKTQKWYLMPPCLTRSIIRYESRVKWSNPGKGVAPSLHLGVVGWLFGFYGISTFVGYLMPNLFLNK